MRMPVWQYDFPVRTLRKMCKSAVKHYYICMPGVVADMRFILHDACLREFFLTDIMHMARQV